MRTAGNTKWWDTLRTATGEYVALLDGDDYWTSYQKLQRQVEFLDLNPDFVLCGHDHTIRNERSQTEEPNKRFLEDFTPSMQQLIAGNRLHTSSLVMRNGMLCDFPSYFLDLEFTDWPLQILLGQRGGVRVLSDSMSMYRVHAGGAWSSQYLVSTTTDMPSLKANSWRQKICFWKLLNCHLNYEHEAQIRELTAFAWQQVMRLESLDRSPSTPPRTRVFTGFCRRRPGSEVAGPENQIDNERRTGARLVREIRPHIHDVSRLWLNGSDFTSTNCLGSGCLPPHVFRFSFFCVVKAMKTICVWNVRKIEQRRRMGHIADRSQ